ncbi:MAG: IclR family transcriptional regulator [Acidimicrobiales bacterium]
MAGQAAGQAARQAASVTSRALTILGAFDAKHVTLTLSELARRSDLPLATAHRLVGELVSWGALVRSSTGSYEIGQRIWELGLLAPVPSGLRQVAAPFLQDVYRATSATVHFAVREGTKALYLDRISGNGSIPLVSRVGGRLPLHTTGVGKVLLAYAPGDVQARVLSHLILVTRYSITDGEILEEELRAIRRDGYAHTQEEMSLGACSLAVPVRNGDSEVVAALGVVVGDLEPARSRLVAALNVAANGIQRCIRGRTRVHGGAGDHGSGRRQPA